MTTLFLRARETTSLDNGTLPLESMQVWEVVQQRYVSDPYRVNVCLEDTVIASGLTLREAQAFLENCVKGPCETIVNARAGGVETPPVFRTDGNSPCTLTLNI